MNTGVILEIKNGKAILLKSNGEFVTTPAQQGWEIGDVVTVKRKRMDMRPLYAIAACFVLLLSLSTWGYQNYFKQIALISLDVNPSIEIGINRFERVISADAFNSEDIEMLTNIRAQNRPVDEVLKQLMTQDLAEYIKAEQLVTLTVLAEDAAHERQLLSELEMLARQYLPDPVQIDLFAVDQTFVESAHVHHVSAGKYKVLLELKDVLPDIDIDEYTHHSITDIKSETELHRHRHDIVPAPPAASVSPEEMPTQNPVHSEHSGKGNGHAHGNHD